MKRAALVFVLSWAVMVGFISSGTPALAADNTDASGPASGHRVYDGETLFRGLAFGQGPVADLFAATASIPDADPAAMAVIDQIVERMAMLEPGFFDSFAASIQSGDHLAIRSALREAGELTARAAIEELGEGALRGAGEGDTGDCIFIAGAIVAIVAAVVTVVIDVTAFTVVNLVVTGNVAVNVDYFYASIPAGGELTGDIWVNDIALTLAA